MRKPKQGSFQIHKFTILSYLKKEEIKCITNVNMSPFNCKELSNVFKVSSETNGSRLKENEVVADVTYSS